MYMRPNGHQLPYFSSASCHKHLFPGCPSSQSDCWRGVPQMSRLMSLSSYTPSTFLFSVTTTYNTQMLLFCCSPRLKSLLRLSVCGCFTAVNFGLILAVWLFPDNQCSHGLTSDLWQKCCDDINTWRAKLRFVNFHIWFKHYLCLYFFLTCYDFLTNEKSQTYSMQYFY